MQKFERQQTTDSPYVLCDASRSIFEFRGPSYAQDAHAVYAPVMDWTREALKNNALKNVVISCTFHYINSSSIKYLTNFFSLFEEKRKLNQLEIIWHYSEEDLAELGNDLKNLYNLNLRLVKVDG